MQLNVLSQYLDLSQNFQFPFLMQVPADYNTKQAEEEEENYIMTIL